LFIGKQTPLFAINGYMFRLLYQTHHLDNRLHWYSIEKPCILSFQFQYGSNISHLTIVYFIIILIITFR